MAHLTMEQLIDFIEYDLAYEFSNEVSQIYFGDIGVYLPSSFGGSRRDQKAIIALNPMYNRLVEGTRTAASEYRELGVEILVLVNITPFFTANPDEAYGERMLVRLTTSIADFLTRLENVDLQDRVSYTEVRNINWEYRPSDDQALRAAGIEFVARVYITRQ